MTKSDFSYSPYQLEFWAVLSPKKQRVAIKQLISSSMPVSDAAADFVRALMQSSVTKGHWEKLQNADYVEDIDIVSGANHASVAFEIGMTSGSSWREKFDFQLSPDDGLIHVVYQRDSRESELAENAGNHEDLKSLRYEFTIDPKLTYPALDETMFQQCRAILEAENWNYRKTVFNEIDRVQVAMRIDGRKVQDQISSDRFTAICLLAVQQQNEFAPGLRIVSVRDDAGVSSSHSHSAPAYKAIFDINGTRFSLVADREDPQFPRTFAIKASNGGSSVLSPGSMGDQLRNVVDPKIHITGEPDPDELDRLDFVVRSRNGGTASKPFRTSERASTVMVSTVADIGLRIAINQAGIER